LSRDSCDVSHMSPAELMSVISREGKSCLTVVEAGGGPRAQLTWGH